MSKFLLIFLAFFSFSNLALAGSGCATGTSGAISGVVICAVDDGKSFVSEAAGGLILMASVVAGVFLVVNLLNK
jgi:hypothetical protein